MKNLYLFQFSRVYDGQVYLPLAVGMLWAYARTIPAIREKRVGYTNCHGVCILGVIYREPELPDTEK